jgi:Holliday junction resolvase-like predicted endonuclease
MRLNSRRKDTTHDPIVACLEQHGWRTYDVNHVSRFVDVIAVKAGRVVFVECKTGKAKPKPHQLQLHAELRRAGAEVVVLTSVEQVGEL